MSESTPPLRNLLAATDFSPAADRAVEHAAFFARLHGAELLLLHLTAAPDAGDSPELEERVARLRAAGLAARGICRAGSPAAAIVEEAELARTDLLVLGTRGQSAWKRWLLGSTARRVIEHAPCPVLAVHQDDAIPPAGKRVLLFATDFSPLAAEAARRAAGILRLTPEDETFLCHSAYISPAAVPAIAPFSIPDLELLLRESAVANLLRAGEDLRAAGIPCRTEMIDGYPADALAAQAEAIGAALIVAGSVGRTGLAHLLIGSTAERLAAIARCPVLVIPPPAPARSE